MALYLPVKAFLERQGYICIHFGLSQRAAVLDHAFRDGANGPRA
jgi:hypothetical protein